MKKYILGALVLIALIIITVSVRKEPQSQGIRVGAILPLSGELAYIGEEMQRGMQLALEESTGKNVTLLVEDDASFDNRRALDAMSKLARVNKSDIILNSVVTTTKALAPVAEREQKPVVILWDSNNELLQMNKWVSTMGFSIEAAGEDMATFAYQKLGFRKVAIVSAQEEWSTIISNAFAARFTALGGTIVLHERTPLDQEDFKTNVAKAKTAGAETIYFPLFTQGNTILARQAREQGFAGPLLSGDVFSDANVEALGPLAENIYIMQLWLENDAFRAKYKAKFGKDTDPTSLSFAAIGYDGIKLAERLAQELARDGITKPASEQLRAKVRTLKFEGITGTTQFDSFGRSFKREKLVKVENGAFHLVK